MKPRLAKRLLHWLLPAHRVEELEGDLEELFEQRVEQVGLRQARWRYWRDVLSLLRPSLLRRIDEPFAYTGPTNTTMIKSYLTVAFRNLAKNRVYSFINIFGLATGMTCCILLLLYIRSELAYDKHHQHANELYLVKTYWPDTRDENPRQPSLYAAALKAEFPEVEQITRLSSNVMETKVLLQVQEPDKRTRSFYETNGYQVDSTFFDLFTYQFTQGDPRTALQDVHSIVLAEPLAHKLFGEASALNRLIRINGGMGLGETFKVTGVFRDENSRSHIAARFLIPMSAGWTGQFLREAPQNFYGNNMFYTYLRLRPGSDAEPLNRKLPAFIEKYARKDLKASGRDKQISLLAVPDLHLYGSIRDIVTPTTSRTYLYILASIAVFTLLLACVNFMNLATARSAKRAAEVGIRKVMGAGRGLLIGQFLGESIILSLFAFVVAGGLVALLLPLFNQLTDKTISFQALADPTILAAFVGLAVLTGILAGSYPAFYLSVFNPVQVLKGRFTNAVSAVALRRGLVVFQFVISIGLVVATLVIQQQMQFLRDKPLGFTKEQQIVIPLRSEQARKAYTALRSELERNNQIAGTAGTQYYPGIMSPGGLEMHRPEQPTDQAKFILANNVDEHYLQLMGFRLLDGRLFSARFPGDTNFRMVVNEAALRKLGVPLNKAIGYKLSDANQPDRPGKIEIVGVVKDFHFEDLHRPIEPYVFFLNPQKEFNYLIAHVNTAQVDKVLPFLEQSWKAQLPDEPFEYTFLDEDFQRNYQTDARTSRIVSYFTGLAILISCLGLFGLAAFAAQQRTKEIGVRKVLGASVGSIVGLLSRDFIKLILLSLLIATPLAWYAMNQWLQDFAYKISVEWWVFILAGGLAIAVALLTVSFQSIRAALMNPVRSLRSE